MSLKNFINNEIRKWSYKICIVLLSSSVFSTNVTAVINNIDPFIDIHNGTLAILPSLYEEIHRVFTKYKTHQSKYDYDLEEFCDMATPIWSTISFVNLIESIAISVLHFEDELVQNDWRNISNELFFKILSATDKIFKDFLHHSRLSFIRILVLRFPELDDVKEMQRALNLISGGPKLNKFDTVACELAHKFSAAATKASINEIEDNVQCYVLATILSITGALFAKHNILNAISECCDLNSCVMEEVMQTISVINTDIFAQLSEATDVFIIKDITDKLVSKLNNITTSDFISGCRILQQITHAVAAKLLNNFLIHTLPEGAFKPSGWPQVPVLSFKENSRSIFTGVQVIVITAMCIRSMHYILEIISDWNLTDMEISATNVILKNSTSLKDMLSMLANMVIRKLRRHKIGINIIQDAHKLLWTSLSYVFEKNSKTL